MFAPGERLAIQPAKSAIGATPKYLRCAPHFRSLSYTGPIQRACETSKMTQSGHSMITVASVKGPTIFKSS